MESKYVLCTTLNYCLVLLYLSASLSQALAFTENFKHPDTCWNGNRAMHNRSRRFLECIEEIFLKEVINELIRGDALLDLLLSNKEELVKKVKVKGSLGCNDCETWQVPMRNRPRGKKGPGERVNLPSLGHKNSLLQYAARKASIAE